MKSAAKSALLEQNLAQRLHRSLTAAEEELFGVMADPSMEVLQTALKNPRLAENHLLVLLKRRDLSEELLKSIRGLEAVEQSHGLKLALLHNPNTPAAVTLSFIPHIYLFELLELCLLPGATPDQRYAAERAIIQRLPATPLGNKLTLARRGTPGLLEALLREGHPQVVDVCLGNPRMKEATVFQFVSSPAATAESISAVARHPRWKSIPTLRGAILKNPKTPAVWFTLFLPRLNIREVRDLRLSRALSPPQRRLVEDELKRRGLH